MRVKLTEAGKKVVANMEIPKEARTAFFSLFPKTSEIGKVLLHYRVCTLDVTTYDEEMCKAIMLLSRPEAYIETIQKDAPIIASV